MLFKAVVREKVRQYGGDVPRTCPSAVDAGSGPSVRGDHRGATTSSATTTPPPQTNLASSDPAVPVAALGSGSNTSTSVAPEPRGDLRGIRWHACPTEQVATLMCGTLAVPYDYANPAGPKFVLAVAKVPALGRKVGTLFFDPVARAARGLRRRAGLPPRCPCRCGRSSTSSDGTLGDWGYRPALQGCAQPQPVLPATGQVDWNLALPHGRRRSRCQPGLSTAQREFHQLHGEPTTWRGTSIDSRAAVGDTKLTYWAISMAPGLATSTR